MPPLSSNPMTPPGMPSKQAAVQAAMQRLNTPQRPSISDAGQARLKVRRRPSLNPGMNNSPGGPLGSLQTQMGMSMRPGGA